MSSSSSSTPSRNRSNKSNSSVGSGVASDKQESVAVRKAKRRSGSHKNHSLSQSATSVSRIAKRHSQSEAGLIANGLDAHDVTSLDAVIAGSTSEQSKTKHNNKKNENATTTMQSELQKRDDEDDDDNNSNEHVTTTNNTHSSVMSEPVYYNLKTSSPLHVLAAHASDKNLNESISALDSPLAVLKEFLALGATRNSQKLQKTPSDNTSSHNSQTDKSKGDDNADKASSNDSSNNSKSDTLQRNGKRRSGGSRIQKRSSRKHADDAAAATAAATTATATVRVVAWVDERDPDQATPLHVAASRGHALAAQLLLDAGADVAARDSDGATPLHKACHGGHVDCALVLLRAGADRAAADVRGHTPLYHAIEHDHADVLTAVIAAPHSDAVPLTRKQLLAVRDKRGVGLLHRAARRGARRCLAGLKQFRADLPDVNAHDRDELAPIHHAALGKSASAMRTLLALGANALDVVRPGCGASAAHLAAAVGALSCLKVLLRDHVTLLTMPDKVGRLPLAIAEAAMTAVEPPSGAKQCYEFMLKRDSTARAAAEAALLDDVEIRETADVPRGSDGKPTPLTPPMLSTMEMRSVNRFGFIDIDGTEHVYEPSEKDIRKEVERGMKWLQMFAQWDKFSNTGKLQERIAKGIPDAVRGEAWPRLTHANDSLHAEPNLYASLLPRESEHSAQIKKDIHRTFPKHILFRDAAGAGQQSLFNVLKCYSLHDPNTGYCQGMGFVAGVLLMYMPEEEAFHVLKSICSNYEMSLMWREGFPALERGKFVLDKLLQQLFPKIHSHLEEEGIMLGLIADKWFMTWFLYTMPFPIVLRIWDMLLGHGFLFMYRIILAFFKLRQDDILESPMEDIVVILKFNGEIGEPLDMERLIQTARSFKFKDEDLLALHKQWQATK